MVGQHGRSHNSFGWRRATGPVGALTPDMYTDSN